MNSLTCSQITYNPNSKIPKLTYFSGIWFCVLFRIPEPSGLKMDLDLHLDLYSIFYYWILIDRYLDLVDAHTYLTRYYARTHEDANKSCVAMRFFFWWMPLKGSCCVFKIGVYDHNITSRTPANSCWTEGGRASRFQDVGKALLSCSPTAAAGDPA
jgi:hypothetical protein